MIETALKIADALEHCSKGRGTNSGCFGCPMEEESKYWGCQIKEGASRKIRELVDHIPETSQEPAEAPEALRYWSAICAINERQEAKGRGKYGQDLEDNDTMPTDQRIEHIQEELIDALKYLEHFKVVAFADGMTANDYQRAALRTAWTKTKEDLPPKVMALLESGAMTKAELLLLNGVLGLGGESGEALDLVKKNIFQGHDLTPERVAEELCDVAWYLAVASHAMGYKLSDIFQMNVDKLKERYPDGFSKERSIGRKEADQ